MNYKKIYDDLIEKRKNHVLSKMNPSNENYIATEVHHIVPKCIGGLDIESNLVRLTSREHYIAHLLLWKIYPNFGMLKATIYFLAKTKTRKNIKMNSHLFQKLKNRFGKMSSIFINSVRLVHNVETHKSFYILKTDVLPKGCKEGRYNKNYDDIFITFRSKTLSIREWAKETNLSERKIFKRYKSSWPIEKIFMDSFAFRAPLKIKRKQQKINYWITNGIKELQIEKGIPIPDIFLKSGYHPGRLNKKSTSHSGQMMISNLETHEIKYVDRDSEIPDGWKKGKWRKPNCKKLRAYYKKKTDIYISKAKEYCEFFVANNLSFTKLVSQFPELKSYRKSNYILQLFNRYVPKFDLMTEKKKYGMKKSQSLEGSWSNSNPSTNSN